VRPFHVAAWIEDFPGSKPTIKLKLAAVRMLYDFLVVRQITQSNPAHSVRGPKYVFKKGKTPVWSREDVKTLLDSIPKDSVSGLQELAFIAAMFYSFARVRPSKRATPVSERKFGWNGSDGTCFEPLQRLGCDPEAAKATDFLTPVGCHTWRATGIIIYLENDGRLEPRPADGWP
jgi:hypothetical protein